MFDLFIIRGDSFMGLFDKILEKKICSICGGTIEHFTNTKLKNGNCCRECINELSPWYQNIKNSSVEAIQRQVYWRKQNYEKLNSFCPTKILGTEYKILIDEEKCQFAVSKSQNFRAEKCDIIDGFCINRCVIDVVESSKEVQYRDSNDDIQSFEPPYFAYSYDFFIEIGVNIPYINTIRFKLNTEAINNGQKEIINMAQSGIVNKIRDRMYTGKSYNNGKTSNAEEVKRSVTYRKYEEMSNDIKACLIQIKTQQVEEQKK